MSRGFSHGALSLIQPSLGAGCQYNAVTSLLFRSLSFSNLDK